MSSGGYAASPVLSPVTQNDSRRATSTLHAAYDRPPSLAPRRRSPSPGSSRRYIPYDSYMPPRSGPSYQDDYPNIYRPNIYRPDHSNTYYGRTPSPDRFEHPRGRETDTWDRSVPWLVSNKSTAWQDRRPVPASPPASGTRDRSRSETMLATRMFEPSDAWKQSHVERPVRLEASRPSAIDRYTDLRIREPRDLSPGRSSRDDRSPPYYPAGGDRYRPTANYSTNGRSEYDSYRPQYSDTWAPSHTRDSSSAIDNYRRDLNLTPPSRSSKHYDYAGRHHSSPDRSITGSISPRSRPRSPFHSRSSISRRDRSRGRRSISYVHYNGPSMKSRGFADADERSEKTYKSRSSSRSSIASTHVSDNQPPLPRSDSPHHQPQSNDAVPSVYPNSTAITGPVSKETFEHPSSPLCPPKSPNLAVDVLQADYETGSVKKQTSCIASLDLGAEKHQVSDNDMPEDKLSSVAVAAASKVPNGQNNPTQTNGYYQQSVKVSQASSPHTPLTIKPHGQDDILPSAPIPIEQQPALPSEEKSSLSIQDIPTIMQPADEQLCTSAGRKGDMARTAIASAESATTLPPKDIPSLSDAKSTAEALRIVVMTRLLCDRQTREERMNPVLMANFCVKRSLEDRTSTNIDNLINEFYEGKALHARMKFFASAKQSLVKRFAQHQATLEEKVRRLREEYLSLHQHWLAHCATLNEQARPSASESEGVSTSGRTTRRTTSLGDAVRSDLEMEQIIASLGIDELTDPNQLSARNLAVIPDMISVTHGQVDYLYDDTNHLVGNPSDFYGPRTGIHDWTEEEKEIFLDKFAAYPKQFGIIADHLPNKTASQCVDFYYLHKKISIDFRKVVSQYAPNKRRRRRPDKQKGNGLLADIRQHDLEVHRDSALTNGRTTRGRNGIPPLVFEPGKPASSRRVYLRPTSTSTPTPEPESRSRRGRDSQPHRLAVPINQDDAEEQTTDAEPRPAKRVRRSRKPAKPVGIVKEESVTPLIEPKFIDQSESSNRRKPPLVNIQWCDEDKSLFLALLSQHGDDFKRIAASMPNKTTIQVSNFYKSNLIELDLEKVAAGAPKRSPTPEVRDSWKVTPHYPGSGIMSPVSGIAPDISSMSYFNAEARQPNGTASTRRMHIHELLSSSNGGVPGPPQSSWFIPAGRDSIGGTLSRIPEPAKQYRENHGNISSMYFTSPVLADTHPLPLNKPSSRVYPLASIPPPSLASIQTKSTSLGQSTSSHDPRHGPSTSSTFDNSQAYHSSNRLSGDKVDNPYPASHGSSSPFFLP